MLKKSSLYSLCWSGSNCLNIFSKKLQSTFSLFPDFIEIVQVRDYDSLEEFHRSSEWEVKKVNSNYSWEMKFVSFAVQNISSFVFSIHMTRVKTYYIFSILLPCLILTLIIVVPYMLPFNVAPQKVLLPITLILSFNIFLLLMDKIMPKTHEMPIFGELETLTFFAQRFFGVSLIKCIVRQF